MSATVEQVDQLRRMTDEPDSDTYTDGTLENYIERFPLDEDTAADATEFDLPSAAALIWSEKAAAIASNYDFSADGASYKRSQAYQHAVEMVQHFSAQRAPGTITAVAEYPETADEEQPWIVNLPEEDD